MLSAIENHLQLLCTLAIPNHRIINVTIASNRLLLYIYRKYPLGAVSCPKYPSQKCSVFRYLFHLNIIITLSRGAGWPAV